MDMNSRRRRVALVDLRRYAGYQTIAIASLKAWARQDPELRGRADISLFFSSVDASLPELADELTRFSPGLIGLSCYVWNIEASVELAGLIKRRLPGAEVILGGPEAGPLAETLLAENPAVDYVAVGEGEETFRRLLRHLVLADGQLEDVSGLAFRRNASIVKTGEPAQIDLTRMVSPYQDEIAPPSLGSEPTKALVETSRGCPFTCKFCDWGARTMRYVPLSRIGEQFRRLSAHYRYIELSDADILMHKTRGPEILRLFLEETRGTDCALYFSSNPVFIEPRVADILALAPERFVVFAGIQSTNPEVFRLISRTFDREKIESNLTYLRGVAPTLDVEMPIIYGLPGDDLAGFKDSLDWAIRWSSGFVHIYHTLVLPGTDLEKSAAAMGLEYQPRAPHQVLSTPLMDRREVSRARELAFAVNLFQFFMDRVGWRPDGEVSPVLLAEEWMRKVRAAGLDLYCGVPIAEVNEERMDQLSKAFRQILESPILCASLELLCRRFAGEHPASGARPPAERRLVLGEV